MGFWAWIEWWPPGRVKRTELAVNVRLCMVVDQITCPEGATWLVPAIISVRWQPIKTLSVGRCANSGSISAVVALSPGEDPDEHPPTPPTPPQPHQNPMGGHSNLGRSPQLSASHTQLIVSPAAVWDIHLSVSRVYHPQPGSNFFLFSEVYTVHAT